MGKIGFLEKKGAVAGGYLFGFFNSLLPCPATVFAIVGALESASIITGLLVFLVYAAGTTIVNIPMAYGVAKAREGVIRYSKSEKIEVTMNRIMGVITIIIGIIFILGIFSLTEMEISGRGFPIFAFAFGFGLLHGFTPCEHSWPFLVPYSMVTARKVREVLIVATAFCIGIFTSAIINGVIYGGVGWAANSLTNFAETAEDIVPRITGAILIIFGAILLWKPTIFHGGHERGNKDINKH